MQRARPQAADDTASSQTIPSTAGSLANMVTTASPRQASETSATAFAPCAINASALAGVLL